MVSSVEGKKATLTTTSVYHSSSFTGFICLPGFSKLVSLLSGWRAPTFLLIAPFPYSSSSCSPLSAYNLWGIIWLWPQFCGWLDLVLPQQKRCGVTSHLQRRRTFMDRKRTERCVCRHCICKKKQEAISVCVCLSHIVMWYHVEVHVSIKGLDSWCHRVLESSLKAHYSAVCVNYWFLPSPESRPSWQKK